MADAAERFLFGLSFVYLCAFLSLYVQIPGLYGRRGLLPVHRQLQPKPLSLNQLLEQPTLLRFAPSFGLDAQLGMELLCIMGICISFLAFLVRSYRDRVAFFLLWIFYLSCFSVGQTFLWFQWDILLLECGFLAIFVAPMLRLKWKAQESTDSETSPHRRIAFFLVRWLFFRLMFASGVVKLQSGCPTWWGLTALQYHYESQCIPTPLAWFAHNWQPVWLHRLAVVNTHMTEIGLTPLVLLPIRAVRVPVFWFQLFLQIAIILTGNYNFFNLLTICILFSLLDGNNQHLINLSRFPRVQLIWRLTSTIIAVSLFGALGYYTTVYFNLRFANSQILSKTSFVKEDFDKFVGKAVPFLIFVGLCGLVIEVLSAFVVAMKTKTTGRFAAARKLTELVLCVAFGLFAAAMFAYSLVPFTQIDARTNLLLPQQLKSTHSQLTTLELSNGYGLFRRMTGVGGRPEVVVEYTYDDVTENENPTWHELEFLYKPGNLSRAPPFVAPHQPRLDWQMWFAALGSSSHNPWFINFIYRLFSQERTVIELIESSSVLKPRVSPRYVRALLYHYHYTKQSQQATWWRRELQQEYLPLSSFAELSEIAVKNGFVEAEGSRTPNFEYSLLAKLLVNLRGKIGQPNGAWTLLSMTATLLVLKISMFFSGYRSL